MSESIRIPARHDAYPLSAQLSLPAGRPRAAVLVAPAMAVPATFYTRFADHLAAEGAAALVLDYRGIGASRRGSLRGFRATFHEWGERDLAGALDHLRQRFAGVPLKWVGHSAGGQLLGLIEEPRVEAALFVACSSAYYGHYQGGAKAIVGGLFQIAIPALSATLGYLPMRRFRQGEDVPGGVAMEWARWGRDPRYVYSYASQRGGLGFDRFAGPIRSLSIADDAYAPRRGVEALLELYSRARKELVAVDGASPVGHFGWFRKPALWPEQTRWLLGA